MLLRWIVLSRPKYPSMEPNQTIAYISDVGAYSLKPLFITGCVITTVFLDLSFAAERYLRHNGRLARNTSITQKVLSWTSIVFAVVGSVGLIGLAVFDTYRYASLHNLFLLFFMAGYVLSAIFTCAEYQRLGIHYRDHRVLRASFWVKLAFILVEVGLAIVFGYLTFRGNRNVAAVVEWAISFIFTGYIISFFVDLLPSVRTKSHIPQGMAERGRGEDAERGVSLRGAGPGEYEQNLTNDSAGPHRANGYADGVNGYKKNGTGRKSGWARWRNF
jgi:Frag1/DRAM/Sfk1 family